MPQVSFDELVVGAKSGRYLISFPTDTVPALAARPDGADMIFVAKQRSADKPLILMGADADSLWSYVAGTDDEQRIWQQVAARFWPGALTLVLPASDRVPATMNPKDPSTIGIRVPNHELARAILAQTGPLATTSVNRSGEPALQDMQDIAVQFPSVLTLATTSPQQRSFDSFTSQVLGVPSTVVRWHGSGWDVLRQGAVVMEDVQ